MNFKTARLYARVGLKRLTFKKAKQLLRYWLLTTIFKKPIPWVVEFSITYRCQCSCPHCSVGEYLDKADKKSELSTEQVKSVLTQIAEMGIPKVDFFGGEPLLRDDILELVSFASRLGLSISITTNGWQLSRGLVRGLKKAGISYISISLDSDDERLHDRLRGIPGLYKIVMDGIQYCHEEGVPCLVSTYVTRNKISQFQLYRIIDLSKKAKASGVRVLFPIISGRWERDKLKIFTEEEEKKVIDSLDKSFAFIEGAYSVRKGKKVCQSLSGKMFNISPYGDVQICVAFPDTFGNVKDTPLADLLKGMYSHPIYLKNKDGSCCSTTDLRR